VQDVEGVRNALDDVWRSAPVDILVNNAGVNVPQPVLDVDEDSWDAVVDTNLKGTLFVTQAFARLASRDGRPGVVISIGSQAGTVGIEERAAYCASEGGLVQLTKVLAIELAPLSMTAVG
jgi:2-deoxy-D-gluconate 3-dehydrogenase